MTGPRAIRVFVSSTFRDMQTEREELVKRVFPELRRRCAQRGVAWSEVDLRWGVTDEAAAEGAVLPICLREIELSRPYFIGLLGQRYGWVPDAIPADLAAQYGWLSREQGRSVTEMEILHGVLNDPDMAGLAFFYLRDPAWVDAQPAAERATYVDDDAEAQQRLGDLRARVRGSGHPARDYPDPVALGALVAADLGAVLDRLFPEGPPPDPLDREAEAHAAFAATRFDGYVARPALEAALDGIGPVGFVDGEAGAGKSALVSAWASTRRAAGERVLTHHVGATADSARWPVLARRVIAELARLRGSPPPAEVDDSALPRALVSALATVDGSQPVTIVLDGLDQLDADDTHLPLFWLPETMPPGVRLVVTAGAGAAHDELARRGWPVVTVGPLAEGERRALTTTFLATWSKALDDEPLARLVAAPTTGNPLFLRTVLDELRQWGDHDTLDAQIDRHLAAPDMAALYALVLARYEHDFERGRPGLVGDAMRFVWAARRGLAEAELLDALGDGDDPLPRALWSPLFIAAEHHLVAWGTRLSFAHQALRAAVEARYAPGPATHAVLADHLLADGALHDRVLDELPYQLAAAGRWDDLAAWLARREAFDALYRHDLADLRSTWTAVEAASAHRAVDAYRPLLTDGELGFQVAVFLGLRGFLPEAIAAMDAAATAHRAAGDHRQLVACLLDRGAWQIQTGDIAGAAAAYEEAAALAPAGERRVDVLGGQAAVARARGDGARALALLTEQEGLARELGLTGDVERSLGTQAAVLSDRGDFAGAVVKATEAEAAAREVGDPQLLSAALLAKAQALAAQGRLADAVAVDDQLAADARRLGDRYGLCVALVNGAVNRLSLGDLDQAGALAAEARSTAPVIGATEPEGRALHVLAVIAHRRGEPDRALGLLDEEAALADRVGDANGAALALGERATILRERGDLAGALAAHVEEQRRYETTGSATGVATSIGNQAAVRLQAGDIASGTALLADQEARCRAMGWAEGLATVLGNQATVLAQTGDATGAEAKLREQQEVAAAAGLQAAQANAVGALGVLRQQQGDLDGALTAHREQEALATSMGDPWLLALSLGNQCLVARARGDVAGALGLLRRRADVLRGTGHDDELLKTLGELGGLLVDAGQPAPAIAVLREAEPLARATIADPIDTRLVLARLGVALVQTGQLDDGERLLVEARARCEAAGDRAGLAAALQNLALVAHSRGDIAGALALTEQQIPLAQEAGDGLAVLMGTANRGELLCALGRTQEGLAALEQAEQWARQNGLAPMADQITQLIGRYRPA